MRTLLLLLGVLAAAGVAWLAGVVLGLYGEHLGPGEPVPVRIPETVISARAQAQAAAARQLGAAADTQILFGDLHVHTTFSTDAFMFSLPMNGGQGAHPLADACDFARFCASLDFWSINDHAEALTPRKWQETRDTIRQCNAVGGSPDAPDVVAFLGWEWTQVGRTAKEHWGHKNVVLRDLEEGRVPTRPIHSGGFARQVLGTIPLRTRVMPALLDFENRQRYYDWDRFVRELSDVPDCKEGVHVRELPDDCMEAATTPQVLFEKLAQWGVDSLVIPHGTSWGFYTPADSAWDKQLDPKQHDPERQTLLEVMSGHGNSEEYREWRPVRLDAEGRVECPEPSPGYLPSCWRAGQIIEARCREAGRKPKECDARAAKARQDYAISGLQGHLAISGERPEDWLDAGQCADCYLPPFNHRPQGSAQYITALSRPAPAGQTEPLRFRFGFIASSDVHTARPGTGYKEVARREMTDQSGPVSPEWHRRLFGPRGQPLDSSRPVTRLASGGNAFAVSEFERQNSFWLTGGLAAVHAESRTRDGIWHALERKQVYGTSGERILLWFDLLNPPAGAGPVPMGGSAEMETAPAFEVRAVGAFEQKPGCPEIGRNALGAERLDALCAGECYHPSDRRRQITRIEVVRIRPQRTPDEDVTGLIEDPWRSFACPEDPAGCTVRFEDPDFVTSGRDAAYYVRALHEPTPAINADNLRCERDAAGQCVSARPCWGDYRTPDTDACLAPNEERAWSSPIHVDQPRPPQLAAQAP